MSIEALDPRNTTDVDAVAHLHLAHLPGGPVARLGPRFLKRFYYSHLVRQGLIGCKICKVNGLVVGFISYTRYPNDFMSRGVRRGFLRLCWLMAESLLSRSVRIKDIRHVLRIMRERKTGSVQTQAEGVGEVISMATLPEYQGHVPPGGKSRITSRLFESAVAYFRENHCDRVLLLAEPSNRASNLFCTALGCEFEKVSYAGAVTHRYTYFPNGRPADSLEPSSS